MIQRVESLKAQCWDAMNGHYDDYENMEAAIKMRYCIIFPLSRTVSLRLLKCELENEIERKQNISFPSPSQLGLHLKDILKYLCSISEPGFHSWARPWRALLQTGTLLYLFLHHSFMPR